MVCRSEVSFITRKLTADLWKGEKLGRRKEEYHQQIALAMRGGVN